MLRVGINVRFVPIADITEAAAGAGQDRRGACWWMKLRTSPTPLQLTIH
jgi:hypothetical protein